MSSTNQYNVSRDFLVECVRDALVHFAVSGDEPVNYRMLAEKAGVGLASITRMLRAGQLDDALEPEVLALLKSDKKVNKPSLRASRALLIDRLQRARDGR